MKRTRAECLGFLCSRCCDSGARSCSGGSASVWRSIGPQNATAFDLHAWAPATCALPGALHARAKVFDFLEQSAQVVAKSVLWSVSSGLP